MSLGSRLKEARKGKGLTQKKLAQLVGAKHNSISNWENDQNRPDPLIIEKLCGLLEVTPNYLLMGNETPILTLVERNEHYSDPEWELVQKYRQLDMEGRDLVTSLLDYLDRKSVVRESGPVEEVRRTSEPEVVIARISTQSVSAGTGAYLDDDYFDDISLISNGTTKKASFCVPVSGDSMEPRFHDGDILMVENAEIHPGEIGIFTLNGQGYVKVLGGGELVSLNSAYEPIPMNDSVVYNGKVMGVLPIDWIVGK